MPQSQSTEVKAEQTGDLPALRAVADPQSAPSGSLAEGGGGIHRADILKYGRPGKVLVNDLSERKRSLDSILNARTTPVVSLALEFALVSAASFAASNVYHQYAFGFLPYANFYLAATLCLAAIFVVPSGFNRDYAVSRLPQKREQLRSVILHWNTAYLLFAFTLIIGHATDFYSRGALIAQYFAGALTAFALRLALGRLVTLGLQKGFLGGKRVLIVGDAASVIYATQRLRPRACGIDIIGTVTLPTSDRTAQRRSGEMPPDILEAKAAVEDITRRAEPDEIIMSLPWSDGGRIRHFVDELSVVPAAVHLAPDASASWAHRLTPARVGPLPTLRLSRAPLTLRDRVLKRCFDLGVGSALLLAASPIFLIIGLLIKLDSRGPVFFRQRRHGFNQGEFRIFKFRTMTTLDDGAVIRQAERDDIRITRLGRFLRRTNLDEIPQLFNVIAGDMSLVGPRPHALAHNNEFEEKIRLYARRHNVKPGITGWSQVNGYRGETDTLEKMQKRVDCDVFYIDNWSILFDMMILYLTIFSLKSYQNAY